MPKNESDLPDTDLEQVYQTVISSKFRKSKLSDVTEAERSSKKKSYTTPKEKNRYSLVFPLAHINPIN